MIKHGLVLILLYISLLFQSTLAGFLAWGDLIPDFYFLVVIYLCLLLPEGTSLFWACLFGWMRDGVACLPLGTYGSAYLLLAWISHRTRPILDSDQGRYLYVFFGCFFTNFWVLFLSLASGGIIHLWGQILTLTIYTTIFTPFLNFFLGPLKWFSWKGKGSSLEVGDISHKLLFHCWIKEDSLSEEEISSESI